MGRGATIRLTVGPPPAPWGWPLVLVTMIVAWLLDFCIAAMIELAAFVTEEVAAFEMKSLAIRIFATFLAEPSH